jgi:hypothetical protein
MTTPGISSGVAMVTSTLRSTLAEAFRGLFKIANIKARGRLRERCHIPLGHSSVHTTEQAQ